MTVQFERVEPEIRQTAATQSVMLAVAKYELRAIPPGLPFLVSGRNGQIVEPVFAFMVKRYVVRELPGKPTRLRRSSNSRIAVASDLKDFFSFLDQKKRAIEFLDVDHVNAYAGTMIGKQSPSTKRLYRHKTVVRRMSTIREFVTWMQDEGRLANRFPVVTAAESTLLINKRKVNRRQLIEAGSADGEGDEDAVLNVLTREEASAILRALGPRPSELKASGSDKGCRDRVACEFIYSTGIRRQEAVTWKLKDALSAFAKLNSAQPFKKIRIVVTGKGNKPRDLVAPSWILAELKLYVDTERNDALVAGRKLYGRKFKEPDTVFVNAASSTVNRGMACQAASIYRRFKMPQAGLLKKGLLSQTFRLHDLRHTYATWDWINRKRSGDTEPSKYIQAQLGHSSRETTEEIYLSTVSLFEAEMFDDLAHFLDERAY